MDGGFGIQSGEKSYFLKSEVKWYKKEWVMRIVLKTNEVIGVPVR